MLFQSIALNWARVATVSSCSSNYKMAEQRQENNKPKKRTIEIWGRRSLPGTMRQTTRSRAYSFRRAIFAPALRWWALTRFSLSFPNWTVLGKKDRRSLQVAAAVSWFGERTARVCRLSSLFVCSMGGMSRKHSAELKTPRSWGQHRRRWNERESERFYQTSAESLEVAFTHC